MDNDLNKFIKCDVFTPDNIVEIMSSKLLNNGTLLEPSVGKGNLLKFLNIKNYSKIDIYELKKEYLDNINIDHNINKYNMDFLKSNINIKYDNIIMNPPYIKIQDLSLSYRTFIKKTFLELKGLIDIYYAFIIKCINLLKDDGIMVSITPNSYLYNKSSYELRKFLLENKYIKEIIDFKDKKIFPNVSVYCCITIFTKIDKDFIIYNNNKIFYKDINNFSLFDTDNKNDNKILKDICKISNGIATLRDSIFIHKLKLFEEPCWNIITNSKDTKYIIFPYENGKIINENDFKNTNPLTYNYLENNKEELSKRDKGNKKYASWYAFGRTQSLVLTKKKCIYIPCFLNPNDIKNKVIIKEPILFHGCLCIEPNDENDLEKIKNIIINNIKFIEDNSSKRSGGWINISSRILYLLQIT